MKKGFTLVELSIVLVIIGLLVGGILVAQSLIESTQTQRFVRELQQIEASLITFESRYRNLPGDSNLFSGGDRDGWLDQGQAIFQNEISNFWPDLQLAGFLNTYPSFSNTVTVGIEHNTHIPEFELGANKVGSVAVSYCGPMGTFCHYIADYSASNSNLIPLSQTGLLPVTALAIDQKMDDGVPGFGGNIISIAPNCAVSGSYDVNNEVNNCALFINMFTLTEN